MDKTVLEYLQELPDGYRERAIKNCTSERIRSDIASDLNDAIYGAFMWSNQVEGFRFWSDVAKHARGEGDLPPIPET